MLYADQITKTISDPQFWGQMEMAGTDFTITYGYPDAPEEVQHLRIAVNPGTDRWVLYTLREPHGPVDESADLPRIPIDPAVISRIRSTPGTFAGTAPTRAFINAFFGIEN